MTLSLCSTGMPITTEMGLQNCSPFQLVYTSVQNRSSVLQVNHVVFNILSIILSIDGLQMVWTAYLPLYEELRLFSLELLV